MWKTGEKGKEWREERREGEREGGMERGRKGDSCHSQKPSGCGKIKAKEK